MKKLFVYLMMCVAVIGLFVSCNKKDNAISEQVVNFYGWGGYANANDWIDGFLTDLAKEKYGVTVNRVGMNIDEILNLMMGEKQAGKEDGSVDLVWINGENFYTAKKADLLYGPITDKIPNFKKYIDENSPDVKYDFGYETEGYEAPYGKGRFVFVYDSNRMNSIPKNHKDLFEWCKQNPGKFTYAALPDFTGSAFVRGIIYDMLGFEQFLNMKADKALVKETIQPVLDYLNNLKPYLWNEGKTYPVDNPTLNNLYASGELLMTMSYNPHEASSKIDQGIYPESTRTFVFENGTIGSISFVAIPKNAAHKEVALKLIDCILSVEAQAKKSDPSVWGHMPALDFNKLTSEEKKVFESIPLGKASLPLEELATNRLPEMSAAVIPIIEEIWLEEVASK